MTKVILQSQDLTNTSRNIDSCADQLKTALKELDMLMSNLDSVWSDVNSKTYLRRYEELKQEFPEFEQAVRNYGVFLNNIVEAYRREFMEEVSTSVNG